MKRILTLLFLLPLLAVATNEWIVVALDNKIQVAFPARPEESERSGNPMWVSRTEDGATMLAMSVDFQKFGLDSAAAAEQFQMDEFLNSYRDGILGQLPEGKLIAEKKTMVQGHPQLDYTFTMGTEKKQTYFSRSIFVGTRVYSLSFIDTKGDPKNPLLLQFFSSLRVKP